LERIFSHALPWWAEGVLGAEDLGAGALEAGEGAGAGVAVVGLHHGGEPAVAHSIHAAVGEHVRKDVGVPEQEGVVAGFPAGLSPPLDGGEIELPDGADFVHLDGDLFA